MTLVRGKMQLWLQLFYADPNAPAIFVAQARAQGAMLRAVSGDEFAFIAPAQGASALMPVLLDAGDALCGVLLAEARAAGRVFCIECERELQGTVSVGCVPVCMQCTQGRLGMHRLTACWRERYGTMATWGLS